MQQWRTANRNKQIRKSVHEQKEVKKKEEEEEQWMLTHQLHQKYKW